MASASAASEGAKGHRGLAAVALFGVSALALLYLVFLFQIFNDPSVRALGFNGLTEIRNISFLVLALLLIVMVVIWMRWVPVQAAPTAAAGGAGTGAAGLSRKAQVRIGEMDPASRPGAPPSWRIPAVAPDALQGGWKRYRFPAERTGGVCIDSDIVVDEGGPAPTADNDTPRGRYIVRMRDEVARVCVRCDLIGHCHGKVAALITREEMLANHECVPGLKRIATQKIEAMKAPPPPPAAEAAPEAVADAAPDAAAAEAAPDAAPPATDDDAETPKSS